MDQKHSQAMARIILPMTVANYVACAALVGVLLRLCESALSVRGVNLDDVRLWSGQGIAPWQVIRHQRLQMTIAQESPGKERFLRG